MSLTSGGAVNYIRKNSYLLICKNRNLFC